jgi:3-deoxy-D-manno-octulosonic-acid transferase
MLWFYNIGIIIYGFVIRIIAPFNIKAKLFVEGRKNIFEKIAQTIEHNKNPVWFHFASLGEFEQGRPVLEKIKSLYPQEKIIVTFFSPSGYEIRKNYALADGIFYLPLDTAKNAKRFIGLIRPKMAIFTKYEFWFHYFSELQKNEIPLYLISGIFRPNQIFFKWYGGFYRDMLGCVTHFFLQNKESEELLKSIGFENVNLSGDTRFDRVFENAENPKDLPVIKEFCNGNNILVAGSTWPEDESLLAKLAERNPDWKFIIAPHEIHPSHIDGIEKQFSGSIRFSNLKPQTSYIKSQILIIDNIGMLSSLYQYGNVAFIGGGFGAGIHNTLEAVAFGLPVIFGPNYQKFQEAKDLIKLDIAKSIKNEKELLKAFNDFQSNKKSSAYAKQYINDKKGATENILSKIKF